MNCPECRAKIAVADVNIQEGIAVCRACSRVIRASALLDDAGSSGQPLVAPPGSWDSTDGNERRIGATTRSAWAFFIVPFMCVWSGGSLGSIYGSQFVKGTFNPGISLFGIPFILGTLILGSQALMMVFGRVDIRIRGGDATVFTGVGPFGITRRFRLSEFSRINESIIRGRRSTSSEIVLEGSRRLAFGRLLNAERRYFIIETLRPLVQVGG